MDGKVLLCHEPESGLYIIPGGGVEGHEDYGLYRREHAALKEFTNFITKGKH